MKKRVFGKKLSRERATREALFVSLVAALILNKKIKTTKAKAKAIAAMVDKLVTLAKKDSLASKREILKKLKGNKKIANILWTEIVAAFQTKNSGFTRIVPLLSRKGDMAEMVRLEWTYENLSTKTK